MANTVEIVISAADHASSPIKGVASSLGELEQRGTASHGVMSTLGGVMSGVVTAGLVGVAGAATGVIAGIGGAVKTAADFESAMSAVGAVAGANQQELAGLSQTALQLGMDTTLSGVSATDAAKAMQELASGGVSVADIMGGAAYGALQLASAGGVDVATAAGIAALALKDFNLAGSDLPHVADLFAAAANSSAVTVVDLGESLKYVGPVASTMGISLEELTGTLAELGDKGIKASTAGTALRGMITNLAAPTKQQSGVMKELNLQFFDGQGHMKNLAGISEELHTKLGGLTDQQRTAALATLFGNEGLTAAQILYDGGAAAVEKYTKQVNAGIDPLTGLGAAATNGALRNDNLKGSLAQLGSVWETLTISIGTAFIPAIRGATDGLSGFLTHIMPIVTAALPGIVAGLQNAIGAAVRFGQQVAGAVQAVVGAFRSLFSGQTNFGQFVGGIENMIGAVLGKLGELGARAAPYIGRFFSAIGSAIQQYGPQVLAQFQVYANRFSEWITTTAIPWLMPRLYSFLGSIMNWLGTVAAPALAQGTAALAQALGNWISEKAIPYLKENLPKWLAAIADWMRNVASPAIDSYWGPIAEAFGNWITEKAIPWLKAKLPEWIAALGDWLRGTASPAVDAAFTDLWNKAKEVTGNLFNEIGTAIRNKLTEIKNDVGNDFSHIGTVIRDRLTETKNDIGNKFSEFGTTIRDKLTEIKNDIGNRFSEMGTAIHDKLNEIWTDIKASWANIKTSVYSALTTIWSDVKDKWGEIKTAVSTALDDIWTDIKTGWSNAVTSTTSGMADMLTAARTGATNVIGEIRTIPGRITGALGDLGHLLYGAGRSVVQGFLDGINSLIGDVQAALSNLSGMIPSWKGPPERDSVLLYDNGQRIMQGLMGGIASKVPDLRAQLGGVGDTIGGATFGVGGVGGGATVGAFLPAGGAAPVAAAAGTVVVNVAGSVVTERQLVDAVHSGLLAKKRSNVSLGLS